MANAMVCPKGMIFGGHRGAPPTARQVYLARVTTGLATDRARIATAFRRFDMDESNHLDETEIM